MKLICLLLGHKWVSMIRVGANLPSEPYGYRQTIACERCRAEMEN
jgi:hypothetical protein